MSDRSIQSSPVQPSPVRPVKYFIYCTRNLSFFPSFRVVSSLTARIGKGSNFNYPHDLWKAGPSYQQIPLGTGSCGSKADDGAERMTRQPGICILNSSDSGR